MELPSLLASFLSHQGPKERGNVHSASLSDSRGINGAQGSAQHELLR